jgi:hypothetical protein
VQVGHGAPTAAYSQKRVWEMVCWSVADSSSYGLAYAAWWYCLANPELSCHRHPVRTWACISHSSPSASHCRAQVRCCLRAATTHTRLHAQSRLSELFIVREGRKDAAARIESLLQLDPGPNDYRSSCMLQDNAFDCQELYVILHATMVLCRGINATQC